MKTIFKTANTRADELKAEKPDIQYPFHALAGRTVGMLDVITARVVTCLNDGSNHKHAMESIAEFLTARGYIEKE